MIYKPGQGYWTRLMSAISAGLIVLLGAAWLWDQLRTVQVGEVEPVYIQGAAAVLVIGVFGYLGFWLIGRKPRVVDFMIATEGEMKKVNWSTRREVIGSTWVVIAFTIFIALFCFGWDLFFQFIFRQTGILDT
jgi:preprotein translocase SecE subunit